MNLSNLILTDIHYKNNAGEYELGPNNELIENDLNKIADDLYPQLEVIMSKLAQKRPFLAQYKLHIDYYALAQVLEKFTRVSVNGVHLNNLKTFFLCVPCASVPL